MAGSTAHLSFVVLQVLEVDLDAIVLHWSDFLSGILISIDVHGLSFCQSLR
jgi:hypothetical protein